MRSRSLVVTSGISLVIVGVGVAVGGFPAPHGDGSTAAGDGTTDLTGVTGSFDGAPVDTIKGTVQVTAIITDGVLTDVVPISLTNDGAQSDLINARAIPLLREAVLASQSAAVEAVSGATYSSAGYLGSLQSALDAASGNSATSGGGSPGAGTGGAGGPTASPTPTDDSDRRSGSGSGSDDRPDDD